MGKEWEIGAFPSHAGGDYSRGKKKLNSYAGFVLEQAKRAERKEKKSEKERELVDGNPFFFPNTTIFSPLIGDYFNTC